MTNRVDQEMVTKMETVLVECQILCKRMEALTGDLAALGMLDLSGLMKWYANQIRDKLPMGMLKGD